MAIPDIILTGVYVVTLYYTIFLLLALLDLPEPSRRKVHRIATATIMIPAHNEQDSIEATLNSLFNLKYDQSKLQIIVVDDGSTDGTAAVARAVAGKRPNVTIISTPNQGKWRALNTGLEHASGELFICLDADSRVHPDALRNALPYFVDDKVAVVLPLMKVDAPQSFFQKVQWYEYIINMYYKHLLGKLNAIHVAPGPFSIYKTELVRKVGGFRSAHKTEDLEIVFRFQEHRYRVVQTLDSIVYTNAPSSYRGVYNQRYRWFRGSLLNVIDYRRLMFRSRYGHFGMFQLPSVLVNAFVAPTLVVLLLYLNVIQPLYQHVAAWALVNFDLLTLLKAYDFNFTLMDVDVYRSFILLFFLSLSIGVVTLSHRKMQEKFGRYGKLSALFFLVLYFFVVASVWIGLFKDLALRRDHKW